MLTHPHSNNSANTDLTQTKTSQPLPKHATYLVPSSTNKQANKTPQSSSQYLKHVLTRKTS